MKSKPEKPSPLKTCEATLEVNQTRFDLRDRLALIPPQLTHTLVPMLLVALVLWLINGPLAALGTVASVLSGVALFPMLLPWLPTQKFSTKGFFLGGVVALVFALAWVLSHPGVTWWIWISNALAYVLTMPPVTAYLALSFVDSAPGQMDVEREKAMYIPIMALIFGNGIALTLLLSMWQLVMR